MSRVLVFISIVLAVWLAEHLYVGWRLLSLPLAASPAARRSLLALLVLGFLAYPASRFLEHWGWQRVAGPLEIAGAVWMGLLFLLLSSFLAADLVTAGGLLLRPWLGTIRTAAAGLALLGALVAVVWAALPPRVREVEVVLPGLPAPLDGTTLVQVSDVHLDGCVGQRRLDTIVEQVTALAPDVVLVTGDVIDGDVRVVEPLIPTLARLRGRLGSFAVLGNHEFFAGPEASTRVLTAAGLDVLDNRAVEVAAGLWVAGVPDDSAHHTPVPPADVEAAVAAVPAGAAVVLMQHAPQREERAARAGVGLMLNGHTHGGQIWPFHALVRLFYPHLAGVYRVGEMTQVVSRGAGLWGPPMRLFAPADVVRVTLRSPELQRSP